VATTTGGGAAVVAWRPFAASRICSTRLNGFDGSGAGVVIAIGGGVGA